MTDQAAIAATMTKTTFRQECTVTATIHATPEKIWRLLTDIADMVRWNSTLTSMEGTTELGGTVKMRFQRRPAESSRFGSPSTHRNAKWCGLRATGSCFLGFEPTA